MSDSSHLSQPVAASRSLFEEKLKLFLHELRSRKWTIGFAESCTGGLLSSELTKISGVSDIYLGAVVSYANSVKVHLLNVSPLSLESFGAVSQMVAQEMAHGACQSLASDCSIAITGIAGPTGGSVEKPVGTVFIAVQTPQQKQVQKFFFQGDRGQIQQQTVVAALELFLQTCHNIKSSK